MMDLTKKSLTRVAGVVATAALGAGVAVAVAVPAQAAASNCPAGFACVWEDSGYVTNGIGANLVKFERYIPDFGEWHYSSTTYSAHDSISSAYNNGNVSSVRFYQSENHKGWYIQFAKQTGSSNLAKNGANDAIDSGYFSGFGGAGTF